MLGVAGQGLGPAPDFTRYRFGKAWSDDVNVEFGRNGCNTRDDILRRDLTDLVVRAGTCYAQTGVLHDPYTGTSIDFVRGPDTSDGVQIDHLVSLADAWYKGAREWDDQRRRDFANDPRNLLAVSAKANFDKAFRDAASWLPPNAAFRCEFVARQVEVKTAYGLWVSAKEKQAMAEVLTTADPVSRPRRHRAPVSARPSCGRRAVRRAPRRPVRRRGPPRSAAPPDRRSGSDRS